jgi:alpha-D-xyloside xylohydrolase
MMRALVMDFASDKNALDINDQFMFGRSIMVSPVTNAMYIKQVINGRDTSFAEDFSTVKTKETYLPSGSDWYDFWTGEKISGGKKTSKETPLDIMPLYIKAGSILPIGPSVQYAEEKKWDNLEIRIYPGADGEFVLYEDENDNYNYEKGVYSTIGFTWDDKKQTLTVQDRKGSFPGMLESRTLNIVMVSNNKAVGENTVAAADKVISYTGKKMVVKF